MQIAPIIRSDRGDLYKMKYLNIVKTYLNSGVE